MTETDNKLVDTIKINTEDLCTTLFPGFSPIDNYTKPSMETFYCKMFKPKIPALLEGNFFFFKDH